MKHNRIILPLVMLALMFAGLPMMVRAGRGEARLPEAAVGRGAPAVGITRSIDRVNAVAQDDYTVAFNANFGMGTMAPQTANVPTALKANTFTRTGYSFSGWNTATNGSGTAYANGATYAFDADVTLYAQWTANTYTVTFDANGGTTPNPATMNVTFGAAYGDLATTSRAGYTFNGWFSAATGGTQVKADTIVTTAADHTLYAQWTALPNRTVTFNANGGTGTMTPQTANVPTALKANAFTRTGYSFSGWNTASNGSGTPYANGATYAFDADVTLYAQWTALPNHTVTFNANSGTGSMTPQTANVPTALKANAFTRTGYSFSGWNTAANGSGVAYADGVTYAFDADVTLYAQWTALPNRTVTFNANSGTGAMTPQTANVPTALTVNVFTRTGYGFGGWNTAANGSGVAYVDGAIYPFDADVTLYAQWTAITYTVTFDANGGTAPNPEDKPVTFGAAYGALATTSRPGYTFNGWFTDDEGGTQVKADTIVTTAGDHTLYAQWTALPCHTLTLNHDGGGDDPTAEPSGSPVCGDGQYYSGESVGLTATPDTGWKVKSWSGTTNDSSASTSNTVTMPNKDHAAAVTYEKVCYKLTLSHSGSGGDPTASPAKSTGCNSPGTFHYDESINLSATPTYNWRVKSWSGATGGPGAGATANSLKMPAGIHTVSVAYEACYSLTLALSGGQGGPIQTAPGSSTGCPTGRYVDGASIGLTASPAPGWVVAGWEGTDNDASTATTNSATMPNKDHRVSVAYDAICYSLALSYNAGRGTLAVSPINSDGCLAGRYVAGQSISLTATPNAGYHVAAWERTDKDTSTATTNKATMPADNHTIKVTFSLIPPDCYTLTLGRSGEGAVPTADPTRSASCVVDGQYTAGAVVSLTAAPAAGWRVASWSGTDDDHSVAIGNAITMPAAARTATVTYEPTTYRLYAPATMR